MLVDDKHKAIFIHIPKTGGMSIENALGYKHHYKHHRTNIKDQIKWDNYFKFTFVRNPYDRLISAFKYNLQMEINIKKIKVRNVIKNICHGDFEQFVLEHLETHLHELWFKPQVNWLKRKLDFIGRFETLENDFSYIKKYIDIEQELPKINSTNTTKIYSYTSEMYDITSKLYAKDFETLGYKIK